MLREFCIFLGHIPKQQGCFSQVFHTSPRHVLHFYMWLSHFISDIESSNYMCTSCGCSENSAFSWDIYPDTGVVFFSDFPDTTSCRCSGFFQDIFLHCPGTFTWTPGLLFLGFSRFCRCSGNSTFSWDIYLDMGLFFSSFPDNIMQMPQLFSGHIHRHRGCFFRVFHTVETSDIIIPRPSSHSHKVIPGFSPSLVPLHIDGLGCQ